MSFSGQPQRRVRANRDAASTPTVASGLRARRLFTDQFTAKTPRSAKVAK